MQTWHRDTTHRLCRSEPRNNNPTTVNQMEGSQSNHGENEYNQEYQDDIPIKTLCDYLQPTRTSTPSCMVIPSTGGTFDIKPGIIQLLPKFHGLDSESPYLHLKEFDEVCSTL